MSARQVTATGKNDGVITKLCNDLYSWDWSPRSRSDAISDIESGRHRYFVRVGYQEVDIHVAGSGNSKYLRTDPDKTESNNLHELPDC